MFSVRCGHFKFLRIVQALDAENHGHARISVVLTVHGSQHAGQLQVTVFVTNAAVVHHIPEHFAGAFFSAGIDLDVMPFSVLLHYGNQVALLETLGSLSLHQSRGIDPFLGNLNLLEFFVLPNFLLVLSFDALTLHPEFLTHRKHLVPLETPGCVVRTVQLHSSVNLRQMFSIEILIVFLRR